MAASRAFRVVLLSDQTPRSVGLLASRVESEVSEARICGILYRPPLGDPARPARTESHPLRHLGNLILRILHACPARPNGKPQFELVHLAELCARRGWPLRVGSNWAAPETREWIHSLDPDLGIVWGTEPPQSELADIPPRGILCVRQRRTASGAAGSRPPQDQQEQICLQVHWLGKGTGGKLATSASLPIEPYDTPASVGLKSALLARDLLIGSVAGLGRGSVREEQLEGVSGQLNQGAGMPEIVPARSSTGYRVARGRPVWKLLLRTLLLGPGVVVRNWVRRIRHKFPVVILYHHLVADRPHPMGMPTELFLRHVSFLKEHYRLVSLEEAVRMLKTGKINAPTVALTFDDGYGDNFVNLRAVAEETGIPITLFVCTEHLSSGREFAHDLEAGQRGFFPMNWGQVRLLSQNGMEIGSHTRSHFDCGSAELDKLVPEIEGSKRDLEEHLGVPVKFFAFPWGNPANMSKPAVELGKKTYSHILSACGGANSPRPNGSFWHLKRRDHPNDLWELELTLQGIYDLEFLEQESQLR